MNKTSIIGLITLLLLVSVVSATSGHHVNVYCPSGWWDFESHTCQQWELQGEFNTVASWVDDNSYDIQTNQRAISKEHHRITKVKRALKGTNNYIDDNEAKWSTDHRGTSLNHVIKYLENSFMKTLESMFVPKSDYEQLQNRVEELEIYVQGLNDGYTSIYEQGQIYYGTNNNGLSRIR